MKAWVLHGSRDLRLEQKATPSADAGNVVVRVKRAGICGTDLHYYAEGRVGAFVLQHPFVPGHEFSGEVVEAGAGVSSFARGARVTVDPTIPCRTCVPCVSGRSNLCTDMRVFGSASSVPHLDGGFQEYVSVPASCCHRVPDSMDDTAAALVEPIAVAVHAVGRAGGVAGKRVLLVGAGAVGQTVLSAARTMGAARIAVTDPDSFARRFSLEHGADAATDPAEPGAEARLLSLAQGGFDVAFETSGAPSALSLAIRACARGATIVQIGTLPADAAIPVNLIMSREIALLGSFRFGGIFDTVVDMIAAGRIEVSHLVTGIYPFEDLPAAIESAKRKGSGIKVQVTMA